MSFYLLPRFDPCQLRESSIQAVAFGVVTDDEASRLMEREDLIRRGFGDEVDLVAGDSGLIKDARGRWTMFRVCARKPYTLAEALLGPIQGGSALQEGLQKAKEQNGSDSGGTNC